MQRGGRVKGVSDPGFPEIFPGILAIPSDPGNNFVERGVSDPVSRIFLPGENFVPEIPGSFFREKTYIPNSLNSRNRLTPLCRI